MPIDCVTGVTGWLTRWSPSTENRGYVVSVLELLCALWRLLIIRTEIADEIHNFHVGHSNA